MKQTKSLQEILDEEVDVDLAPKVVEYDGKPKILYNEWGPEQSIEEMKAILKRLKLDIPIEGVPF